MAEVLENGAAELLEKLNMGLHTLIHECRQLSIEILTYAEVKNSYQVSFLQIHLSYKKWKLNGWLRTNESLWFHRDVHLVFLWCP
jgi:hypothetical protein